MLWQFVHGPMCPGAAFVLFKRRYGTAITVLEHVEQGGSVHIHVAVKGVEARGMAMTCSAQGIDGLVGGDAVQPGTKSPALVEELRFFMHAQKHRLKDFFGKAPVAQITAQVAE